MDLLARLLRDLSIYVNRASIIVGVTLFDSNVGTLQFGLDKTTHQENLQARRDLIYFILAATEGDSSVDGDQLN